MNRLRGFVIRTWFHISGFLAKIVAYPIAFVFVRVFVHKVSPLWRKEGVLTAHDGDYFSSLLRTWIRLRAGISLSHLRNETAESLWREIDYLVKNQRRVRSHFVLMSSKRVLFPGQCYYNPWYLSRALRKRGWKADVLNWDLNEASQIYYHGEDFRFTNGTPYDLLRDLRFFCSAIYDYDLFHFSNVNGICFGFPLQVEFKARYGSNSEVKLLKGLGKKIAYTNNGCNDGVSQSAFSTWGPESVCSICIWRNRPDVCNDEKNLQWGLFRNSIADFQCLLGGNRIDSNLVSTAHEAPEFYCLDPDVWRPNLDIPPKWKLTPTQPATVWLYHGVGNRKLRTLNDGINIKSSHIYLPLIEKLALEGLPIRLLEPSDIPNQEVRFLQAQADIFLEMLTYGWFGANAREAMMLGKPVICFVRPEWLATLREEIPEYAEELPIVNATPSTVETVLRQLIQSPEMRREIGARSRAFALKWHSAEAGAKRFDKIYSKLLSGDPILLQ